jgi:inorganic pyrophosphatase
MTSTGEDDKVLCVPATDPRWQRIRDITDIDPHLLQEIHHFFDVYKELYSTASRTSPLSRRRAIRS